MSTASVGLVEAYMIRKVYKEKMNKMDNNVSKKLMNSSQEKAEEKSCRRSASASASGGGCFSLLMFKKIHPNTVPSSKPVGDQIILK
ncbi:hypothetical protein ACP275_03G014600 [Erythranthe tilingii]